MNVTAFKDQFAKHLDALVAEVKEYPNETSLWEIQGQVSNSAGTLVLHLMGNLHHFIGAQLGNTGYVRQREKEFSERHVPVKVLLEELEKTRTMLQRTFDSLTPADLQKTFPLSHFGEGKTVYEVLLVLLSHFNYHLGQVNYHRRLIG